MSLRRFRQTGMVCPTQCLRQRPEPRAARASGGAGGLDPAGECDIYQNIAKKIAQAGTLRDIVGHVGHRRREEGGNAGCWMLFADGGRPARRSGERADFRERAAAGAISVGRRSVGRSSCEGDRWSRGRLQWSRGSSYRARRRSARPICRCAGETVGRFRR